MAPSHTNPVTSSLPSFSEVVDVTLAVPPLNLNSYPQFLWAISNLGGVLQAAATPIYEAS